ncbi:hypothetical protein SprV_0902735000 [Sparganum proliferum]
MDKTDYANKANQAFNDREAYIPIAEDPMKKQAPSIKKTVNELTRKKLINSAGSKFLTPNDTLIARASGLPKVHKEGTEVVAMANVKPAREFLEAWYSSAESINRHVDLNVHCKVPRSRPSPDVPNHHNPGANTNPPAQDCKSQLKSELSTVNVGHFGAL